MDRMERMERMDLDAKNPAECPAIGIGWHLPAGSPSQSCAKQISPGMLWDVHETSQVISVLGGLKYEMK